MLGCNEIALNVHPQTQRLFRTSSLPWQDVHVLEMLKRAHAYSSGLFPLLACSI